jgi:hypothetical protein
MNVSVSSAMLVDAPTTIGTPEAEGCCCRCGPPSSPWLVCDIIDIVLEFTMGFRFLLALRRVNRQFARAVTNTLRRLTGGWVTYGTEKAVYAALVHPFYDWQKERVSSNLFIRAMLTCVPGCRYCIGAWWCQMPCSSATLACVAQLPLKAFHSTVRNNKRGCSSSRTRRERAKYAQATLAVLIHGSADRLAHWLREHPMRLDDTPVYTGKFDGPLCVATRLRRADVVRVLQDAGASPNGSAELFVDRRVWPRCRPILVAVDNDDVEILRMLIAAGADLVCHSGTVDELIEIRSAVREAAGLGRAECLRVLLEAGADAVDAAEAWAVGKGRPSNVEFAEAAGPTACAAMLRQHGRAAILAVKTKRRSDRLAVVEEFPADSNLDCSPPTT